MSIISVYEPDRSGLLYERFVSLAASYLDSPDEAVKPIAQVPLENLFRLLEMYKYDAFSDETRSGILAVDSINSFDLESSVEEPWYKNIKSALSKAFLESFSNVSEESAIEELENNLRLLSKNGVIESDSLLRTKHFFSAFLKELNKG